MRRLHARKLSGMTMAAVIQLVMGNSAVAQDYVDLEAEKAAAQAAGQVAQPGVASEPYRDPYGAQPAGTYPSTSYGVQTATTPSGAAPPGAAPMGAAPHAQSGGSGVGSLFLQIQQLQQDVMRLNGIVEEQAHELRQLKEQSLQRYMDIDKRLNGGASSGGSAVAPVAATPSGASSLVEGSGSAALSEPIQTKTRSAVEQPGETEAYRAAYALVQGREFERAVSAFQQFLQNFPEGKYAPNSHYWLGELYLVIEPPDLEASRQSFALLLSEYPQNSKAPDALYKLGKVQFMKGNRDRAREYLDLVIRRYSKQNAAVAKLAREFIAENY